MFTKRQVLRMGAVLSRFRSSVVSTTFENRIFQGPTAFSASDTKGNYRKYMFVSEQKGTKLTLVVLETVIAARATARGEKDAEGTAPPEASHPSGENFEQVEESHQAEDSHPDKRISAHQ